jgi:hypothetical protein
MGSSKPEIAGSTQTAVFGPVALGEPFIVVWHRADGTTYEFTVAFNLDADGNCVLAGSYAS